MAFLTFQDIKTIAMAQFPEAYDALPPLIKNEDEEVPTLQVGTLTFERVAVHLFAIIDENGRVWLSFDHPSVESGSAFDRIPLAMKLDFLRPLSYLIPRHFDWYADPWIPTRIPFQLDAYVRYWYAFHGGDAQTQLAPYYFLRGFEDACWILQAAQAGQSDPRDGWAWVDKEENDRAPIPVYCKYLNLNKYRMTDTHAAEYTPARPLPGLNMPLGMYHDYPSGAVREHNITHGGPYRQVASLRGQLNEERAARMRAESELAAERSVHSWTRSELQTVRRATPSWIPAHQDYFHLLNYTSSFTDMPPTWFL